MRKVIASHISECDICQCTKYDRNKTQGKLMSLPIPKHPWEYIAMYFITGLPTITRKMI